MRQSFSQDLLSDRSKHAFIPLRLTSVPLHVADSCLGWGAACRCSRPAPAGRGHPGQAASAPPTPASARGRHGAKTTRGGAPALLHSAIPQPAACPATTRRGAPSTRCAHAPSSLRCLAVHLLRTRKEGPGRPSESLRGGGGPLTADGAGVFVAIGCGWGRGARGAGQWERAGAGGGVRVAEPRGKRCVRHLGWAGRVWGRARWGRHCSLRSRHLGHGVKGGWLSQSLVLT